MDISKPVNIVVGSGKILFNPLVDGVYQGFRYLAETPGFTLTVQSESLQVDGSDGPIAERIRDIPIRVTRSGRMSLRDISPENQGLFIIGDAAEVNQASTPVVDEAIAVQPGRFYQLGTSINPTGVRNVTAVDVQDETDTTTYVADTDYKVHAEMGMIEILEGGAIGSETLHVDYTPAAETRTQVTSHQQKPAEGEFKFVADNTEGSPSDVFLPRVTLTPDGELPFKSRENPLEAAFNILVQTRSGFAQAYIDGRAAAGS
ncbi:hypothetical protein PRZ61_12260 [Halomonas pacifica]|uniref:phage tail tube protein n=1 Tax=Bisbaumannia pacifica TaxID=77098 RepID=UPI002358D071|nr:hypothetical protein [Halomonas pacifica]MDC8804215.1 hypothetical protein [Halomonas pacifica]